MENKKIVIAGGTGFIGQALAAFFGKDNDIVILGRHVPEDSGDTNNRPAPHTINNAYTGKLLTAADGYRIQYLYWDGLRVEKNWAAAIDGCDLVINLAGKSVNCRYTSKNKQEIFDSRTDSTRAIGLAIRDAITPPKVWINAASATIYRHAEDRPQDEYTGDITDHGAVARRADISDVAARGHIPRKDPSRHFNDDFSVQVCKKWEKTFDEQRTPFTRKVTLRMAITLGTGGVIVPYLHLLKFGLGGRQGSGRQMYSWVHIEDLCRIVRWVYQRDKMEGVYNVCAPHPVSNRQFMKSLRKVSGHRIGLPAFTWMLKLGALLIGTETELILKSRWVLPTKLLQAGFIFRYPDVEDAMKDIIGKVPRRKYRLF